MAKQKTEIALRRNTAISTRQTIENPVSALMSPDCPVGTALMSFDPHEMANEQLIFACDDQGSYAAEDFMAKPFQLENWYAKRIEMPDMNTGEIRPAVRVVLVNEMNETLAFVSGGICLSLDLIRMLRGDGPYVPPIPVIVIQRRTSNKFIVLKLQIHSPANS